MAKTVLPDFILAHHRHAKEITLRIGSLRHDVFRLSAGNLWNWEYLTLFLGLVFQVLKRHGIREGAIVRHQGRQVFELAEPLADPVTNTGRRDFIKAFHVTVHTRP